MMASGTSSDIRAIMQELGMTSKEARAQLPQLPHPMGRLRAASRAAGRARARRATTMAKSRRAALELLG